MVRGRGCWTGSDFDVIRRNPKIFSGYSDITTPYLVRSP